VFFHIPRIPRELERVEDIGRWPQVRDHLGITRYNMNQYDNDTDDTARCCIHLVCADGACAPMLNPYSPQVVSSQLLLRVLLMLCLVVVTIQFFFYNSVKSYVFLWCGRMTWLWYNSITICQI
jgi:hypothetical protein